MSGLRGLTPTLRVLLREDVVSRLGNAGSDWGNRGAEQLGLHIETQFSYPPPRGVLRTIGPDM